MCLCSVQLEKERQQREDAEKEKRELEDRLKKYEDEFEKAKLGEFLSCLPGFDDGLMVLYTRL